MHVPFAVHWRKRCDVVFVTVLVLKLLLRIVFRMFVIVQAIRVYTASFSFAPSRLYVGDKKYLELSNVTVTVVSSTSAADFVV